MTGLPVAERYAPLAAFLRGQSPPTTMMTLTLAEIEQIIGQSLPAGASTQTWWSPTREGARRPWVAAGWRVAGTAMRIARPTVTFVRVTSDSRR